MTWTVDGKDVEYTAPAELINCDFDGNGKISSDVVTDLETGDILYLATEASGMRIDTDIRNVPGTVTSDENGFVQYDLDEAGLLELLLDVYYEAEE